MDTVRPCGCKGCRTCLLCEIEYGIVKKDFYSMYKKLNSQVYCPKCNYLYPGWDVDKILNDHQTNKHHNSSEKNQFPGILIMENFLTEEEGNYLMENLDKIPWDQSQSGRRKQNFGPKTNFKRMKLRNGSFKGFPLFSKFVQDKFKTIPLLNEYENYTFFKIYFSSSLSSSGIPTYVYL